MVVTRAPQCLTVLASIRPDQEAGLRQLLRAIGDDINGKDLAAGNNRPHIAFVRSRRIHFARLAILNDPDRGADRSRLLFTSIYDGSLDAHLDELVSITSDMDAIWGACEGYTGIDEFRSFITARAQELAAYYIAFRDETVESITSAIDARRRAHALQDSGGPRVPDVSDGRRESLLRRALRAAPIVIDLARAVARSGFGNVYHGTSRIVASLDRYPLFRLFNWIARNRIPPLKSHFSSLVLDQRAQFAALAAGDEIPTKPVTGSPALREDAVAQNQLTVVTVIDPARVDRVRAVMAAIDSYAHTARSSRLAHRDQHDSLRAMAADRSGASTVVRQRLRRLVGELHRRVCRDDPDRARRHLGDVVRHAARWRERPSCLQAFSAQPPGAVGRVLRGLP